MMPYYSLLLMVKLNFMYMIFSESISDVYRLNNELKDNGLVSKPIGSGVLRFSPPMIINEIQLREGIDIIIKSINEHKN